LVFIAFCEYSALTLVLMTDMAILQTKEGRERQTLGAKRAANPCVS
jgi:hypothetical protein